MANKTFLADDRMIWVDGLTFDNKGHFIFNNNRLHELFGGELDWENEYNLIVWKAYLGGNIKAYLHYYQKD
jgi:hypothetical protein